MSSSTSEEKDSIGEKVPGVKEKPTTLEKINVPFLEKHSDSKIEAEKVILSDNVVSTGVEGHSNLEVDEKKCVQFSEQPSDTVAEAAGADSSGGSVDSASHIAKSKRELEFSSSGDSASSGKSKKESPQSSSSGDLERVPSASSIVKSKIQSPEFSPTGDLESAPSASSIEKSKKCTLTEEFKNEGFRKVGAVESLPKSRSRSSRPNPPSWYKPASHVGKSFCLHDLYVHTFHPQYPELVVILSECCLAGDAKHRIAETLGLNVESVYVFGLFQHTMGRPTKFISDDEPVKYCKNVSFQRFSFDPQLELKMIRNDRIGMELIYFECIYKMDNGLFFPSVKDPRSPASKASSSTSPVLMSVVLQRLRQMKLSYWTFYNRAESCILCSPQLISDPSINGGDTLHVAFDLNYLLFINESVRKVSFFRWDQVQYVQLHSTGNIVRFSVADPSKTGTIVLFSDLLHQYIFSVAIHLIKIYESMAYRRSFFKSEPDLICDYLVFFNDAFKGNQEDFLSMPTRMQHAARVKAFEKSIRDEELAEEFGYSLPGTS